VTDYYAVLGIPHGLNLSVDDVRQRYYALSREYHPDRFMQKPEAERQQALDMSSALNDAYRTLKDPIKRAQHLLSLEGFDIGEQRSKDVPPELLEEVFELNMALEEMRGGDDSVRSQLEQAEKSFAGMLAASDRELAAMFAKYDAEPSATVQTRDALTEIRNVLNRRKYISNLVSEVQKTLETSDQSPATSH
jgi:molecular chaperone HscB